MQSDWLTGNNIDLHNIRIYARKVVVEFKFNHTTFPRRCQILEFDILLENKKFSVGTLVTHDVVFDKKTNPETLEFLRDFFKPKAQNFLDAWVAAKHKELKFWTEFHEQVQPLTNAVSISKLDDFLSFANDPETYYDFVLSRRRFKIIFTQKTKITCLPFQPISSVSLEINMWFDTDSLYISHNSHNSKDIQTFIKTLSTATCWELTSY